MKLKYKHQWFQTEADRAVTDAFKGQQYVDPFEFIHDQGLQRGIFTEHGFANNPIMIDRNAMTENVRSFYTVDFSSDELIRNAIESIDKHLNVTEIRLIVQHGGMDKIESREELMEGLMMYGAKTRTIRVSEAVGDNVHVGTSLPSAIPPSNMMWSTLTLI